MIYHAGSLKVPFAKMEKQFEKQHPVIDIIRKADGSTKMARLIANSPKENIKAKAFELVELLKNGKMDYAWEYLSVAVQNDLNYVQLDDHFFY